MKNKIIHISFIFCFFSLPVFGQEADLFNYSNSFDFANYLYRNAEFEMAIKEYKRVLFLSPLNQEAAIKIHDSYIRDGNYKKGLEYSFSLSENLFQNDTINLLQGKLLLLNHDYIKLDSWLTKAKLTGEQKLYLNLSGAMYRKDWQMASGMLPEVEANPTLRSLSPIVQNATHINYKRPATSAILSAIVPGAGKMYSGYWKDGFFSFLFVGISAWQAYRGFEDKGINSVYGWIMGGITLSFYSGNLYGSVKAANKHNYENEHRILHEYEKAFIATYSNF